MKRIFVIAFGLCMLATAGATGISNRPDLHSETADVSAAAAISQLSAEEVKALQAKYRYYPASDYSSLRSPI